MLKTTTLNNLSQYLVKMLSVFALVALVAIGATAQVYNNGNLSTGATTSNGTAAPAGSTWSEVQLGNVTGGFAASITAGAGFTVADDIIVPAGQRWNISKLTFYAYSTGFAGTTSPFNDVRVQIFNTNPSVGNPTPIFGNLTTNRFAASSSASMFRIFNATPGTTRAVWNVEANINTTLDPGTYWIEWQLGNGGLSNFSPPKTVVGTVTQAGNNAFQHTLAANTWAPLNDGANRQDMPFRADYTILPCVAPTASVLSQVGYATPAVSLINETFTTAAPLPAGWAQQNLSTPAGTNPTWFQGNTAVFTGNTPPGYIACNFNSVGGANTISNWLFAPNLTMKNGDSLTFFTRTTTGQFPDRLQIRRSQNGASTNVGATNASVGDFTDLLLDINPTYSTTAYPTAWTKFTVIMSGLPAGGISGRIAFRYFVENGGPAGLNSDYIGLDDVVYRTPGSDLPPTTCVGSTANLKVDITGGTSPYTVVINTVPPTTPITVTNYISGTSIPVTPAVTTQYTLTSVSGCGLGTGNSGTPTIVVNPATFPPIAISALPDAPLCLGDGTLMTVGSLPTPVTYSQLGVAPFVGINSQKFEPANVNFDNQGADDFTVPAGQTWNINQVNVTGEYFNGAGPAASINVFFYNNAGSLPGTAVASFNNIATFTGAATGNFNITLPSAVTLPPGTYWVSVQANQNFTPAGQWGWHSYGATNVGAERAWRNPNGGFGTPCTNWGPAATSCGVGTLRNHAFAVLGSITGAPLPASYTYLWTPATGLSNPTSNPVAASPMVTTNYTVLVTAPGGCQGTASKTIVINQPPTVTTQPNNVVVCANGSATFTVAATGAGPLTYQWQEQVGGVGAWNNLTNGAPYSGTNTNTLVINPVSGSLNNNKYRCVVTGICNPSFTSNAGTLTVNPLPVIPITPAGPVCGGVPNVNGVALTAGTSAPPVPGSVTVSSGPISVAIPDNSQAGASSNLTVSGIPANATITGVKVNFNIPHTFTGDLVMALKAPNNDVLNLDYFLTGSFGGVTTGFTNTTIGSLGVTALSAGVNPYTGLFRADGQVTATANGPAAPTGLTVNRASYAALISNLTAANSNGVYTLAIYDGGAIDVGTLTSWSITIDYTTPGTGSGAALTYVWSPTAGLYTNAGASIPYTGQNLATVYAAPSTYTVYTVTGTNTTTGCVGTNSVIVNYTPPAPTVVPNPVAMCLGDAAVKLKASTSATSVSTFNSGTISVAIPEGAFPGRPATAGTNVLAATGIPANAVLTGVAVKLNATHAFVNDIVAVLRSPSGAIINLDAIGGYQNNPGANYLNTTFSSTGTTSIATGTAPYTGTWQADRAGVTFVAFGFTLFGGPTGFDPTTTNWNTYFTNATAGGLNGNWTLATYDVGAPDLGTLTNWELQLTYSVGTPAAPAVWSPAAGLFSDAIASTPYVAGTQVDSVWAKPTTIGANNYQVTVNSLPTPDPANPANIVINAVGPASPYPSIINVANYATTGVSVQSVTLTGVTHTWGDDVDILLQSPTGQNVVLMSDVGGTVAIPNATYTFSDAGPAMNATAANASGTYKPTNNGATDTWAAPGPGAITQATPTLASFGNTANVNGQWKLFVIDDTGGDAGNITGGWSIKLTPTPFCTSPATTVVVTVNQPVTITTQPKDVSVCTIKVPTITVAVSGTSPTYQWQVSTNNGTTWTNLANGAPYSGVTTNTLTLTSPALTLSNNLYRVIVGGAAPCGSLTSQNAKLTVNPLPVVVISASPSKLLPGLTTTITSTSSTPTISTGYVWRRDGVIVGGSTPTLPVNVDQLGAYTLTVTDINGCVGVSNTLAISDSASGKVFIYPNPSSGVFQVRYYSSTTRAPRGLNIFDDKGSRIAVNGYPGAAPYSRMDVDLRKYGKGIYWIEVVDAIGERLAVGRAIVL